MAQTPWPKRRQTRRLGPVSSFRLQCRVLQPLYLMKPLYLINIFVVIHAIQIREYYTKYTQLAVEAIFLDNNYCLQM